MTESPTACPRRLEHPRVLEFAEDAVEYIVAEVDHAAQQVPV